MVAHCHEQIKKQLAAVLHFHLHGPTPLECLAASDDESQIVSAQPRLGIRRIVIGKASRPQDHVGRDSALETLLSKSKALELLQAVLLGSAVHNRVPEHNVSHCGMEERRLARPATTGVMDIVRVLEVPRVSALALQQAWEVVALIQKLEDARQNLGLPMPYISLAPPNTKATWR